MEALLSREDQGWASDGSEANVPMRARMSTHGLSGVRVGSRLRNTNLWALVMESGAWRGRIQGQCGSALGP